MPGRRLARPGRPQRRRQVDAGRRADRPHRARCRPDPLRRRGCAGARRPAGLARAGRLRLPALDRDPDADGRGEPVPQRPADAAAAGSAGGALRRAGRARARRTGASRSTSSMRCRATSRSSSARSSRSRARCSRARASSSSTSRPPQLEGARGRRACSTASRGCRQQRRHLPLHLASPRGDLRDLPQRDGAARRRAWSPSAARRRCRRTAWSRRWSASGAPRRRRRGRSRAAARSSGAVAAGGAATCASATRFRAMSPSRRGAASASGLPGSPARARSEIGDAIAGLLAPALPARSRVDGTALPAGDVAGARGARRRLRAARPPRHAASSRSSRSPRT